MPRVGHADLTRAQGFRAIDGQPVADVQRVTLDAGRSLIQTWTTLEPIAKALIKKVQTEVDRDKFKPGEAAKLLSLTASVAQKVGQAATNVLRASEGQAKLALLLETGRVRRPAPAELSQKGLAAAVLDAAAKVVKTTGRCPFCQPIEATAKVTDPEPITP